MITVTLTRAHRHHGHDLPAGSVLRLPEAQASWLVARGVAEAEAEPAKTAPKTTPKPTPRKTTRTRKRSSTK